MDSVVVGCFVGSYKQVNIAKGVSLEGGGGGGRGSGRGERRPRRGYLWGRRPRICGLSDTDAVTPLSLPPGSPPRTLPTSPSAVRADRNQIQIPRLVAVNDEDTGRRHLTFPPSAFFDPDSAHHYVRPRSQESGSETDTQPGQFMLQTFLNFLPMAETPALEPEIIPDPIVEVESLPPTPIALSPDVSPLNSPLETTDVSPLNSPFSPISQILPVVPTPRSMPTIPENAVIDLHPRLAFSADNQVEEEREKKSSKARLSYWDQKKEHAVRQLESLIMWLH